MNIAKIFLLMIHYWSDAALKNGAPKLLRFLAALSLLALDSPSTLGAVLDLQERTRWTKEKSAVLIGYSKQYKKIIEEIEAATTAAAPNVVDIKPFRPRFEKIETEMAQFIEHTNFDAQQRFKDNPLCKKSIDAFQPDLQQLEQNKIDPMQAAFAYSATVLAQCPMSPRLYEATQKLEKIKLEKSTKP